MPSQRFPSLLHDPNAAPPVITSDLPPIPLMDGAYEKHKGIFDIFPSACSAAITLLWVSCPCVGHSRPVGTAVVEEQANG